LDEYEVIVHADKSIHTCREITDEELALRRAQAKARDLGLEQPSMQTSNVVSECVAATEPDLRGYIYSQRENISRIVSRAKSSSSGLVEPRSLNDLVITGNFFPKLTFFKNYSTFSIQTHRF
jgi:hypothetical protein